jgi:hypothetical protein
VAFNFSSYTSDLIFMRFIMAVRVNSNETNSDLHNCRVPTACPVIHNSCEGYDCWETKGKTVWVALGYYGTSVARFAM